MRGYVIWFMIWISFISWVSYASTWTIGWLFEKIWWSWKLVWTNIKMGHYELHNYEITV